MYSGSRPAVPRAQQNAKLAAASWERRACGASTGPGSRAREKLGDKRLCRWQPVAVPSACVPTPAQATVDVEAPACMPMRVQAGVQVPAPVECAQRAAVEGSSPRPWGPPPATSPPCPPPVLAAPRAASTASLGGQCAGDEQDQLVAGVAVALTSMASLATTSEQMTRFHCKYPPGMSIGDYIGRIRRFFGCSAECYVLGLLYIDRLIKLRPQIEFSRLSAHRLIIASMTLAAKFHDDTFYSNKFYAKVGGVPLRELNVLEQSLMQLLDWRLQVLPEEYELYAKLARQAAVAGAVRPHTP